MSLKKAYTGFCILMAGYGFSRGYRSIRMYKDEEIFNKPLWTEKMINGILNCGYYGVPILNIFPTICLINRLEIDYKNLDKKLYRDNYEEMIGHCYHTI
jgi:hypothetical protein